MSRIRTLIFKYLTNYYEISDGKFWGGVYGREVSPIDIIEEVAFIFDLNNRDAKYHVKGWAYSLKMTKSQYGEAYKRFSPSPYELKLTAMLSEQIAAEIDRQIMNDLFTSNGDTIKSCVLNCL